MMYEVRKASPVNLLMGYLQAPDNMRPGTVWQWILLEEQPHPLESLSQVGSIRRLQLPFALYRHGPLATGHLAIMSEAPIEILLKVKGFREATAVELAIDDLRYHVTADPRQYPRSSVILSISAARALLEAWDAQRVDGAMRDILSGKR